MTEQVEKTRDDILYEFLVDKATELDNAINQKPDSVDDVSKQMLKWSRLTRLHRNKWAKELGWSLDDFNNCLQEVKKSGVLVKRYGDYEGFIMTPHLYLHPGCIFDWEPATVDGKDCDKFTLLVPTDEKLFFSHLFPELYEALEDRLLDVGLIHPLYEASLKEIYDFLREDGEEDEEEDDSPEPTDPGAVPFP